MYGAYVNKPVKIVTTDGRVWLGVLFDHNSEVLLLRDGENKYIIWQRQIVALIPQGE
jgi:hypothetical protein